jgi:predicted ATPase/class 3 adenylate cyclase/Tfp pilus assembly protein PilF
MYETCALLQIDIVDSTHLGQQLGDDTASALWQAHDRAARDLLPAWQGREIDKSDGFLLLFNKVADAVGYALAYHRATAALDVPTGFTLKARAGVHVGPVIKRENPSADVARGAKPLEVEGVAKPTTARVMAIARPGQTLLSAAARAALGAAPSLTSARVQGHGHWRLKGLLEPMELFEVGDADAPFEPPPDSEKAYRVVQRAGLWLPLREVRHSLPAERDAFVGRREALQDLARRFEAGARLVSVFGIGGTGKTRFVQRFGWTWLGDYPGGVWFCDLSQATSLDGILHSVGQGLDVPLSGSDPVTQLGNAIAGRGECLVILDNFEQVARFAEETVGKWLDRASEGRFIVTTRELLGIVGEYAVELPPMSVVEGADLFERRAGFVERRYTSVASDQTLLHKIISLLDGLPLAIELAAARTRVMSLDQLLERMRERFTLLIGGTNRSGRQATLQVTLNWSWDLLDSVDQIVLAQLSIFEGSFSLLAAEAIVEKVSKSSDRTILDIIQSLTDKSLVRRVADNRFNLLMSVKEYCSQKLQQHESAHSCGGLQLHQRYWQYYSELPEHLAIGDGCADIDNIVAACLAAMREGAIDSAVKALVVAWAPIKLKGPFRIILTLIEQISTLASTEPTHLAWISWIRGSALILMGESEKATKVLSSGLAAAKASNNIQAEVNIRCAQAEQLIDYGNFQESVSQVLSVLEIVRTMSDPYQEIKVTNLLAYTWKCAGRADLAEELFQTAVSIAKRVGDRRWEGGLLSNLGSLYFERGNIKMACEYLERALELDQSNGSRHWEGNVRCNLGLTYLAEGRFAAARHQFKKGLAISKDIEHSLLELILMINLGFVDEMENTHEAASKCYERAVFIARSTGQVQLEMQAVSYLGLARARNGEMMAALAHLLELDNLAPRVPDSHISAISQANRAQTLWLVGKFDEAVAVTEYTLELVKKTQQSHSFELMRSLNSMMKLIVTHPAH